MSEGSRFFEEKSAVQDTLRRIARRLDELGIAYAVSGGLALFAHGYRRFTEDVDLLVTAEGLREVHEELDGRGYVPPFTGSKNLRDVSSNVRIKFLVTGRFPGDGKRKPVAFPEPSSVAVEKVGIKYVKLPALVELKLASGMTEPTRLRDLSDVIELIRVLDLSSEFADQLAPFVRAKYLELWQSVLHAPKRYVQVWRDDLLTPDVNSIERLSEGLRAAAATLDAMRADGVTLEPAHGAAGGYAYLVTTDPAVARKYGMHDETGFWRDDETKPTGGASPERS